MQTVHIRINDAASGKPTPVRLRCTDAAGNYHAPFGRLVRFSTAPGLGVGGNVLIDGEPWAYIDGACEIDLPPGRIRIQAHKGPEYRAIDETINLVAGKLSLRFTIERRANLREEGWHAGDVRCHHLAPQAALLEAQAEDLAVVNVLIRDAVSRDDAGREHAWLSNILEFSGQQPALAVPGHLVSVNSYNQSPLGKLGLLNCHRVVYPLSFERIHWTLADWCGQCHRKGGLVILSDWQDAARDVEGLANLLLGHVDALEITDVDPESTVWQAWHHLLNCGLRLPLAGGSGKVSNETALGNVRTYAKLGWEEELTYQNWIEAVRVGRTFVSSGPLLWFSVQDQAPGSVVALAAEKNSVHVRAWPRRPGPRSK
jgi:hypothetical protein